ncbi:FAD-dependent monooxygenase [Actinocrinis puniceicyclus]|uniref:FAD-dependent monooxygenase n=1 Tax=Actinocrinis puniceicyclus TaxID=977794 RepID=A0A8J7WXA3_9ACTN|nr:FAD-dependent monooxygenase [Actinocrinis puniceicyclus]MBS2966784.1 FAD-dependent monooxygenase [Actinocrinis puniceicyclus]
MNDTVIIAGASTTGLMLACELGLRGVRAIVLEAAAGPRRDTPAAAINTTSVELLEQRGLMEGMYEDSLPIGVAHYALLWLDASVMNGRNNVLLNQARLNRELLERAGELGVDVRFGHRVTALRQSEDEVTVTVTVEADGTPVEVAGGYLVGCDGADSAVRSLAGIDFPGEDSPFYGIYGDLTVSIGELEPGLLGAFHYPDGGVFMGAPLGPDTLRVVTAEWAATPPAGEVTAQEAFDHIKRLTGFELTGAQADWLARYPDTVRNAAQYRDGRVFLAGDAAHMFFPLGGQRMNTCMQDAVNLGWKLAAAIEGWAPAGLLDTYHGERHPVGARACRNLAAQTALMPMTGGIGELREMLTELITKDQVNRYLLDFVTGLDVRYPMPARETGQEADAPPHGEPHALLGARLGPLAIKTDEGESNALIPLRGGHGVLFDFSGATQRLPDVSGWSDRVDVVAAQPLEPIDAAAVLVRPDGHAAWVDATGGDAAGLLAALRAWFGASTA